MGIHYIYLLLYGLESRPLVQDHILHLKHIKINSVVLSIFIEFKMNRQYFYGSSDGARLSRPH